MVAHSKWLIAVNLASYALHLDCTYCLAPLAFWVTTAPWTCSVGPCLAADYTLFADYSLLADYSLFALLADYSLFALIADYLLLADYSLSALMADYFLFADYSLLADYSLFADNFLLADYSLFALLADYSLFADYSLSADYPLFADTTPWHCPDGHLLVEVNSTCFCCAAPVTMHRCCSRLVMQDNNTSSKAFQQVLGPSPSPTAGKGFQQVVCPSPTAALAFFPPP